LIPPYTDSKGNKRKDGKAHLVLSNPPFGTSESESLPQAELSTYAVHSTKGQSLFVQRMIEAVEPGSRIVTVIDEGVLNNGGDRPLRRHLLATCKIEWVFSLPDETFKPNKINIKSSFIVLQRRHADDVDFKDDYPIGFVRIGNLGYDGAGEDIRGFDLGKLISELESLDASDLPDKKTQKGYSWEAFRVASSTIATDSSVRLDYRYWDLAVRISTENLRKV
jgi:type I restriction enzyme M protein